MAWYPPPRRPRVLQGYDPTRFAALPSRLGDPAVVIPMSKDAGGEMTVGERLFQSLLIGIGVSLGTTIAWTFIDHFFDFRREGKK